MTSSWWWRHLASPSPTYHPKTYLSSNPSLRSPDRSPNPWNLITSCFPPVSLPLAPSACSSCSPLDLHLERHWFSTVPCTPSSPIFLSSSPAPIAPRPVGESHVRNRMDRDAKIELVNLAELDFADVEGRLRNPRVSMLEDEQNGLSSLFENLSLLQTHAWGPWGRWFVILLYHFAFPYDDWCLDFVFQV